MQKTGKPVFLLQRASIILASASLTEAWRISICRQLEAPSRYHIYFWNCWLWIYDRPIPLSKKAYAQIKYLPSDIFNAFFGPLF